VKLTLCLPSRDTMYALTAMDLAEMYRDLAEHRVELGIDELTILHTQLAYIPVAREHLAGVAVREGATHLLWIDADMRFPTDAGRRLLARKLPFVGVNYPFRAVTMPVALGLDKMPLASASGVEEVHSLGFGLVLTESQLFTEIPAPWFDAGFRNGQWFSEDIAFCHAATKAGFPPVVDHDLSRRIRHAGLPLEYQCYDLENVT
jgi:hypothetical protein